MITNMPIRQEKYETRSQSKYHSRTFISNNSEQPKCSAKLITFMGPIFRTSEAIIAAHASEYLAATVFTRAQSKNGSYHS